MKRTAIERIGFQRKDRESLGVDIFKLSELFARSDRGELGDSLVRPQRTEFFVVLVGISGTTSMTVDFTRVPVGASQISVIARGRVRELIHPRGKADAWMLIFQSEFVGELASTLSILSTFWPEPALKLPPSARDEIAQLVDQIAAEHARPADAQQADLLAALVRAILLRAERHQTAWAGPASTAPLARFFTILERDHARTRTVAHYAQQSGLSARRLGELVLAATGKSTKAIIDDRVVLEVKRLLAHTELSVKELAAHVGFAEPTNLVKFFRLHTHTTPQAFRAAQRTFLPSGRAS